MNSQHENNANPNNDDREIRDRNVPVANQQRRKQIKLCYFLLVTCLVVPFIAIIYNAVIILSDTLITFEALTKHITQLELDTGGFRDKYEQELMKFLAEQKTYRSVTESEHKKLAMEVKDFMEKNDALTKQVTQLQLENGGFKKRYDDEKQKFSTELESYRTSKESESRKLAMKLNDTMENLEALTKQVAHLELENGSVREKCDKEQQELKAQLEYYHTLRESESAGIAMQLNSTAKMFGTLTKQVNQMESDNGEFQDRYELELRKLKADLESYHTVKAPISCPSGYIHNPFANSCIRLVSAARTWSSANSDCESSGERLATFETLESQYWFITLRKTSWRTANVWVGGEKFTSGVWKWIGKTPKPLMIAIWGPKEPNNYRGKKEDCLASANGGDFKFNDSLCSSAYPYICEMST